MIGYVFLSIGIIILSINLNFIKIDPAPIFMCAGLFFTIGFSVNNEDNPYKPIFEYKIIEKALKESEIRYKTLIEHDMFGIYLAKNNKIMYVNPGLSSILGYDITELLDFSMQRFFSLFEREDIKDILENMPKFGHAYELKEKVQKICRISDKFGQTHWVQFFHKPLMITKMNYIYQGILIDITKQISAEKDLLESKMEYKNLVEQDFVGIYISKNLKLIFINQACEKLLKISRTNIGNLDIEFFEKLIDKEGYKKILEQYKKASQLFQGKIENKKISDAKEVKPVDFLIKTGKDSYKWLRHYLKVISLEPDKIFQGMIIDVTEEVNAKLELIKSENLFRQTFEYGGYGILIYRPNGLIVDVNQKLCKILKYKKSDLIGKLWIEFVNNEKSRRYLDKISHLVNRKIDNMEFEKEFIDSNGSIINAICSLSIVKNEKGLPLFIVEIINDITELRKTQKELIESEEKFRKLFEQNIFGLIVTNADGFFLDINSKATEIFGYSKEEIKNFGWKWIINGCNNNTKSPSLRNEHNNIAPPFTNKDQFAEYVKKIENYNTLNEYVTKEGKKITCELNISVVKSSSGNIRFRMIVIRDITRQKMAEERLAKLEEIKMKEIIRTEKLQTISFLTGGLAHDFNNILTASLGYIELLNLRANDEQKRYIQELKKSTLKARNIVYQLLTFTKNDQSEKKKFFSLNKIIKESVNFILHGSIAKPKIDIAENIEIYASEDQITQVLHNLLINAIQAMEKPGYIYIKAKKRYLNDNYMVQNEIPLPPGLYALIQIKDEGKGIPKEIQSKIFEPYFTTKRDGSGLGLAMSLSIIKKHKGYITFTSEIGKGTTFYIYLPIPTSYPENVDQLKYAKNTPSNSPTTATQIDFSKSSKNKGKFRILIMDDDEYILNLMPKLFKSIMEFEIEVELSKNGQECIEKFQKSLKNGNKFNLIIMDLTIRGGMGGKETISAIKKIDKNIKVIVSSGYSNDVIIKNYQDYGFDDVLNKPFTMEEIKKIIKKYLLDENIQ
ncbi:MAG: PAS domain S-box protein [Promethearchaeota archaeon]